MEAPLTIQNFSVHVSYEIQNIHICTEPDVRAKNEIIHNFKFTKINRTTKTLNLDLVLTEPFGDNLEVTVLMEKFANGRWLKVPYLPYTSDPCKLLWKYFHQQFVDLCKHFNLPIKCPLPPGNHTLRNLLISSRYEVNSMLPINGIFKFNHILRKKISQEIVSCCGGGIELLAD